LQDLLDGFASIVKRDPAFCVTTWAAEPDLVVLGQKCLLWAGSLRSWMCPTLSTANLADLLRQNSSTDEPGRPGVPRCQRLRLQRHGYKTRSEGSPEVAGPFEF